MGGLFYVCALAVALLVSGCNGGKGDPDLEANQRKEREKQAYLEKKTCECDRQGGVAKLDPLAGYLGCDFPVLKRPSRIAQLTGGAERQPNAHQCV